MTANSFSIPALIRQTLIPFCAIVAFSGCKSEPTAAEKNLATWQEGDKELLVKKCLEGFSFKDEKGPKIAAKFCDCSVQNTMEALSYEKYVILADNGMEEQSATLAPIIKGCKDVLDKELAGYNKVTKYR